jgi:ribulose-phosphate 3-epimerase
MVLIMSVVPGKGGQSFIPETIDKIKKLKKYLALKNLKVDIQVDGGIDDVTGPQCIEAGANNLVSGSFLTKNISKETISKIMNQ